VTREWDLNALRQETLPAALTATGEGCTAPFGTHAGAKTVLLLPGSLRSL
jgi:hypothetical protein